MLTSSSLEAHSHAASRSGNTRCWSSLPLHLEGDLGLWQAVQQELFPKPLKTSGGWTEASSREDSHCVASPGILSVVTAPSDGGTTKGQRVCARGPHRTQLSQIDTLSHAMPSSTSQHQKCLNCSFSQEKFEDFCTPVSSVCGDGTAVESAKDMANVRHIRGTMAQGSSIPVCKPVTPIPECNSSLETAGSTGFNASAGLSQPQSGRRCGSVFASSADGSTLFQKVAVDTSVAEVEETLVGTGTAGPNRQSSASCSSASPPSDHRRQRRRDGGTPPVQYGFPASPNHPSASISSGSAPGSVHADAEHKDSGRQRLEGLLAARSHDKSRRPASASGPRVPTGLLSASLSQAKSAGTSPHGVGGISMVRQAGTRSAVRPAVGGETCSAPLSYFDHSPTVDVSQRGSEAHISVHSGNASAGDTPSAIPSVLMAEMACMGFHRPLRVGSKQQLSNSGMQPDPASLDI